jgi:hypothetical protein
MIYASTRDVCYELNDVETLSIFNHLYHFIVHSLSLSYFLLQKFSLSFSGSS